MNTTLAELLEKYKNDTITHSEWQQLREAILSDESREYIQSDMLALLHKGAPPAEWAREDADAILQSILSSDSVHALPERTVGVSYVNRAWLRYAAALIILLAAAGYFLHRSNSRQAPEAIASRQPATLIQAARTGALLTLADGSTIRLDTLDNRTVAAQNGTQVLLKDGQLVYKPSGMTSGGIMYNAITTAKGKQFNIVLPDGTKVYLNAASSLRYPTAFAGTERKVEVTGEAYFEVAKQTDHPFRVSINGQMDVEVLGTSFNLNAYQDEGSIHATLVEGSIQVIKGEKKMILKPGEQARITDNIHIIKNADVDKALAWKNGIFNFENVGLREMMRQLERWYDIEVVYGRDVPDLKFFGKTSRKVNLATVLEALKGFGLHYEMKQDRILTVFK
jgi:transmembrane sensor